MYGRHTFTCPKLNNRNTRRTRENTPKFQKNKNTRITPSMYKFAGCLLAVVHKKVLYIYLKLKCSQTRFAVYTETSNCSLICTKTKFVFCAQPSFNVNFRYIHCSFMFDTVRQRFLYMCPKDSKAFSPYSNV